MLQQPLPACQVGYFTHDTSQCTTSHLRDVYAPSNMCIAPSNVLFQMCSFKCAPSSVPTYTINYTYHSGPAIFVLAESFWCRRIILGIHLLHVHSNRCIHGSRLFPLAQNPHTSRKTFSASSGVACTAAGADLGWKNDANVGCFIVVNVCRTIQVREAGCVSRVCTRGTDLLWLLMDNKQLGKLYIP